jgi:hypothetical protein
MYLGIEPRPTQKIKKVATLPQSLATWVPNKKYVIVELGESQSKVLPILKRKRL